MVSNVKIYEWKLKRWIVLVAILPFMININILKSEPQKWHHVVNSACPVTKNKEHYYEIIKHIKKNIV